MRYFSAIVLASAGSLLPAFAQAHGVSSAGTEIGRGIFWAYGIVFSGLGLFAGWKLFLRRQPAETRALKRRLADCQRALTACQAVLRNADDYPAQCALTDDQRRGHEQSAIDLRTQIEGLKSQLAAR